MKNWMKFALGGLLGIALGFVVPPGTGAAALTDRLADLALDLGRYTLFPLVFFSLAVSITLLRRQSVLGRVSLRLALGSLATVAALGLLGTLAALVLPIPRLPIISVDALRNTHPSWTGILGGLVPPNLFALAGLERNLILPLLLLAFLLGYHFHHDREVAEPSFNLFDSLSRIFYRINRYLLVLFPGLLALQTARAVLVLRLAVDFRVYLPLLGLLAVLSLAVLLGLYPLAFRLLQGRRNPYRDLFAALPALLGAFFSGDGFFNYGNSTYHLKENLGIPRDSGAWALPVATLFARAGTSLVAGAAFLTVIRSYKSLEITLFQTTWVYLACVLISFALFAVPRWGIYVALSWMSALYGRGLEDGYLILLPVMPLLLAWTALLDNATALLLTVLVSRDSVDTDEVDPQKRK